MDNVVADVQASMQHAADITNVLSSGSVAGVVNSMDFLTGGIAVDEDELMKELDELTVDEDGTSSISDSTACLQRLDRIVPLDAGEKQLDGKKQEHERVPEDEPEADVLEA